MDTFKFVDLTLLAGLLEVQITTLEMMIETEEDGDKKDYLKNELKQYKSVNTKLKKAIANY